MYDIGIGIGRSIAHVPIESQRCPCAIIGGGYLEYRTVRILSRRKSCGQRLGLARDDFSVSPTATWRSPHSDVSWPVQWRVRIPAHGLNLDVRASPADQEQDLAVRYWEGAIDVYAAASDSRIGRGYMELTGYRLPPANKPR